MRLIDAKYAQHIADKELSNDEAAVVQWVLSHTPTVDAVLEVHGRWEERSVNVGTSTAGLFCTACNFPSHGWKYNYCPNCGAKMDLK